jgi:hypothetical protein
MVMVIPRVARILSPLVSSIDVYISMPAWFTLIGLALSALLAAPSLQSEPAAPTYFISGRVVDPDKLHPKDAALMLAVPDGTRAVGSKPIAMAADGSFVTPPVKPGVYALRVVRTPHSATEPAIDVAFELVRVTASDVRDVTVRIRRDTAVTGSYRMESDDPAAPWPPHLHVTAWAVIDGRLLDARGADGAPGGRFVLRNAFGPRLLRVAYKPAPGRRWSPSRVLLDGRDITEVPTDFTTETGRLEVWFTEHPAVVSGIVTDAGGRPVRAAWVCAVSEDPALRHQLSMMSHVVQTNRHGSFRFAILPGRYLFRAFDSTTFLSRQAALQRLATLAQDAVPLTIERREVKQMTLEIR